MPNDAVLLQMKNLRHLSDQNLNFGGAQRVTTENALKDLYIYLTETKFFEINTAVAHKINTAVEMLCHAISLKAIKEALSLLTPKKNAIKLYSVKKQRKQYIHIVQAKSKAKYVTIHSINVSLYYSKKQLLLLLVNTLNKTTQILLQTWNKATQLTQ